MTTIVEQLRASGVLSFPCHSNKAPAVNKDEDWRDVAQIDPTQLNWPSGLFGVVIPDYAVLVDGDWYKGLTEQALDNHLGGELPYATTLIQTTPRGGQHFAFRLPVGWVPKQGSNIGIEGFDTRVGGKGFVCSGEGYKQHGMGIFALAHPETLPILPDFCRDALEAIDTTIEQGAAAEVPTDADTENVLAALSFLPPNCGRGEWFRTLCTLRQHYEQDELGGYAVFRDWSIGDLHDGVQPHNYVEEHTHDQWFSTAPRREGQASLAIGTLFYDAMQKGWQPPATVDVQAAFGDNAAPADVFGGLLTRITESGTDLAETLLLIDEIKNSACNALQRDLLTLSLKSALKEAKVLDKMLSSRLDDVLRIGNSRPPSVSALMPDIVEVGDIKVQELSVASGAHGNNAILLQSEVFGGRIANKDGALRWWTGREWTAMPEAILDRIIYLALMPDECKAPNVNGTKAALRALAPILGDCPSDEKIYYQDGVLDVRDGVFRAHSRDNANTSTLSVRRPPPVVVSAPPPEFDRFLATIFGGSLDCAERCALLQEFMGYTLIQSDLNIQKILTLDGASRAGKGVVLAILREILGAGKQGAFPFNDMGNDKIKAGLRQYDVVIDSDAKSPSRNESKSVIAFMNKVVAGEPVSVPLLYTQEPWEGVLHTKMIIGCNGIPTLMDDSGATTNRFIALYFNRSFLGREDRDLLRRLRGEIQQIADWALEGVQRLIANNGNFTMPQSTVDAMEQLKEANQPLDVFVNEWLVVDPDGKCHSRDIWHAYKIYAHEANVYLPGKGVFMRSLRQALVSKACSYKAAVRVGVTVSAGYEGLSILPNDTGSVNTGAFTVVK